MKTELIDTCVYDDPKLEMEKMSLLALSFFAGQIPDISKLKIVPTPEGFDIEYNGVEIGSYGIRECEFLKWIYGTGCAEPRLSRAIKFKENQCLPTST